VPNVEGGLGPLVDNAVEEEDADSEEEEHGEEEK